MDSKQICKGCLSADRTLSAVRDDLKKLFYDVLFDVEDKSHQLQLCWECTAIMNKFLRFKLQVRWAQKCLAKCMVHHIAVTSLSRLTITNHNLTVINDNTNEDTINDKLPIDFIKTEDNILHHSEYNDLDNESHSEYPDNVEYNEFEYNQAHNNISDLKHDIVEDEILPRIPESKVRKKQRSKTKEIFNESDDEPLKQQNDDVKPRSKRKARDVTKSDRRKIEKPAGVVTNARVTKKLEQLNVGSDHLEMVLLSWEEVEVERRAALANVTFTRHESRCESCIIGFNHRSKLVEHMKKHDIFITKSRRDMSYELHQVRKIDGGHQCDVCQVWCKDGRSLTAHRRRHRLRWRCRACGGAWSRAANAADHTARAHGAPPPTHTCALCGYTAATLGKLRNHIRTHAERQKCDLCGKSFRDRASLRTHLFIHNGEKNYSCPRCDKRFLFKSAMEIHLETHNASAQLYCLQCDMNFKNRMSYNQHMRYNLKHIDPAKLKYACDACDKKFVKASRLQEHKLAVHLKLTPISCTIPGCQFSCSSRPVLRTHIRMQHRDGRDRRNHVCHICGKAYASKNSLEGHLRAHTGERPLRCPRCPASFGYDAALYNHVKHVHLKHKKIRDRGDQPGDWSISTPDNHS